MNQRNEFGKIGRRDFSHKTLLRLEARGISVIGAVSIDGEVAYALNDHGTHKLRTHRQVVELSEKPIEAFV